mmetsp:Transcript_102540/g.161854  ORF Transcript_102540/g.161854 Transcript_102540/m.161854 type:complete len:216 (+) Transcript_102540:535-1182(+)
MYARARFEWSTARKSCGISLANSTCDPTSQIHLENQFTASPDDPLANNWFAWSFAFSTPDLVSSTFISGYSSTEDDPWASTSTFAAAGAFALLSSFDAIFSFRSVASLRLLLSAVSAITCSISRNASASEPSSYRAIARLYLAFTLPGSVANDFEQSSSASVHFCCFMYAKARFECNTAINFGGISFDRVASVSASQMHFESHLTASPGAPLANN